MLLGQLLRNTSNTGRGICLHEVPGLQAGKKKKKKTLSSVTGKELFLPYLGEYRV